MLTRKTLVVLAIAIILIFLSALIDDIACLDFVVLKLKLYMQSCKLYIRKMPKYIFWSNTDLLFPIPHVSDS